MKLLVVSQMLPDAGAQPFSRSLQASWWGRVCVQSMWRGVQASAGRFPHMPAVITAAAGTECVALL